MPRGRFRGTTSYKDSFHAKTGEPRTEIRCKTEMDKPNGELDLMTITREFPSHNYGRPMIHRPPDNELFYDEPDEGYGSASVRASTTLSVSSEAPAVTVPRGDRGNHLTGYEVMTRSVGSSMKWAGSKDFSTTNNVVFPSRVNKPYQKVDRNDFDKHIHFGFDSPVGVSVYGGDFMNSGPKKRSPVYRQMSTLSLEASNGPQETTTTYQDLFQGEQCSPNLPTLTEMDAHLRSSIELK